VWLVAGGTYSPCGYDTLVLNGVIRKKEEGGCIPKEWVRARYAYTQRTGTGNVKSSQQEVMSREGLRKNTRGAREGGFETMRINGREIY
jgi:hypothetical protein